MNADRSSTESPGVDAVLERALAGSIDRDSTWQTEAAELPQLEELELELAEAGRDLQSAILGALLIVGAAAIAGAAATWQILRVVNRFFHGR